MVNSNVTPAMMRDGYERRLEWQFVNNSFTGNETSMTGSFLEPVEILRFLYG